MRRESVRASWRFPCRIAALAGWSVFDIFDGLIVVDDTAEHWLEAGTWTAMFRGYVVLAWWRPLPPAERRFDWIVAALLLPGVSLFPRAAVSDDAAIKWGFGLPIAAMLFPVLVLRRHLRPTS